MAQLVIENTGEISDADLLVLQAGLSKSIKMDANSHGLGLPRVRECARLHNGRFSIKKSTVNKDCIIACMEIPIWT